MMRARFVVRGRVQGVNFRAAAVREATAHGLTGCIWNTDDDAVEIVAEGNADAGASLARRRRAGWSGGGRRGRAWRASSASNARSSAVWGAIRTSASRTRRRSELAPPP